MKKEAFQEEFLSSSSRQIAPGEIVIGALQGFNQQGEPLVNYSENRTAEPVLALSTISLKQQHAGRQVAILFAQGDLSKPVIMGLIHSPLYEMIDNFESGPESVELESRLDPAKHVEEKGEDVYIDGKRVVFEGKDEIVLKCGDASITLTKAGKILIRGKYLQSRSTGVNRILGGSVQVN